MTFGIWNLNSNFKLDENKLTNNRVLPFGFVRSPWMVNGLLRFFNNSILSELLCACNCCNWWIPRCVAWRIAFKLRCRRPRKKWTAGFDRPISEVEPCGDNSAEVSSHADNTSSASIPLESKSHNEFHLYMSTNDVRECVHTVQNTIKMAGFHLPDINGSIRAAHDEKIVQWTPFNTNHRE